MVPIPRTRGPRWRGVVLQLPSCARRAEQLGTHLRRSTVQTRMFTTLHGPTEITRRYVALWLVLIAISALIVLMPDIPVSFPSPLMAVSLATLAGVVALAL